MNTSRRFKCSYCDQSFNHNQCLGNHLSKFHLDKFTLKADLKSSFKHNCALCDKRFKFLRNLRRHERKSHDISCNKHTNRLRCPLCDFATSEKNEFSKHIETTHNIPINTEEYSFQTVNEFNLWKEKVEKETFSKYIKKSGIHKGVNNSRRYYYECHRSGFFVPSTKSKKSLKAKGSKKINGTCPSSIHIHEAADGTCKVKFIQTHVGHKNEIFHIDLTEHEKKLIAKDIANDVPFDEIINRVRDSATESSLKRIHLLKKKDLYNIRRALNLKSIVVQSDDINDNDEIGETKQSNDNNDNDDIGEVMEVEEYVEEVDVEEVGIEEEYVEVDFSQDPSVTFICEITTTNEQDLSLNLVGSSQDDNIVYLVNDNDCKPNEVYEISNKINEKVHDDSVCGFTEKKEKMKAKYLSLLDSMKTEEELEVFEKNLTEIEAAIEDARSSKVTCK